MALSAAALKALQAGAVRHGVFFRMLVNPPLRFWLGVGECAAGIDSSDGAGATYYGFGEVTGLPQLQQLVNGVADRVEFTLSGVSPRLAQMAGAGAQEVKGAPVHLGIGIFDVDWQLLQQPTWLRRMTADYLATDIRAGDQTTWTVRLSVRSAMTGRRRPGLSYWTGPDQRLRSPGDAFCDRVSLYSSETAMVWPRF